MSETTSITETQPSGAQRHSSHLRINVATVFTPDTNCHGGT